MRTRTALEAYGLIYRPYRGKFFAIGWSEVKPVYRVSIFPTVDHSFEFSVIRIFFFFFSYKIESAELSELNGETGLFERRNFSTR